MPGASLIFLEPGRTRATRGGSERFLALIGESLSGHKLPRWHPQR